MSPDRPDARLRAPGLMALASICGLLALAAGCPGERTPTPSPAPSAADVGLAVEVEAASPTESKGGAKEPAPGSLKIEDVGPAAPTLFFLSGMKGYTEPCGCTLDVLLGGVDRIAGYLGGARRLAAGALLIDTGDMLFDQPRLESHRVAQERAKVDVLIQAHLAMGTASTTPGPNDFALGKHFYLDKVRGAGLEILVANLSESEGLPLGVPHVLHEVGGVRLGLIGLVQPDLFLGIEGVAVSDPLEAARKSLKELKKQGAQAVVAVYHGDLKATKLLLESVPGIDFAIVGHDPRETDQVDPVGGGFTLEAYDQGRYIGVLKLLVPKGAAGGPFVNARQASAADMERVNQRIEQVDAQIARLPPATPGAEPPMLLTLREQLAELKAERVALSNAKLEIPADKASFIYRSVAVMPGYPLDAALTAAREGYNASLKDLVPDEPIVPVEAGQAEYVGAERCQGCHPQPTAVWKASRHSHAIDTLIDRDKSFDGNCIGCHVTGYRQPGGSVLGKLQVTASVGGQAFTKKLENVGCEVCHGPGSLHMIAPVDDAGKAQNIARGAPEALCVKCHNEEHSTRFNYGVYVEQILGEGHQRKP